MKKKLSFRRFFFGVSNGKTYLFWQTFERKIILKASENYFENYFVINLYDVHLCSDGKFLFTVTRPHLMMMISSTLPWHTERNYLTFEWTFISLEGERSIPFSLPPPVTSFTANENYVSWEKTSLFIKLLQHVVQNISPLGRGNAGMTWQSEN